MAQQGPTDSYPFLEQLDPDQIVLGSSERSTDNITDEDFDFSFLQEEIIGSSTQGEDLHIASCSNHNAQFANKGVVSSEITEEDNSARACDNGNEIDGCYNNLLVNSKAISMALPLEPSTPLGISNLGGSVQKMRANTTFSECETDNTATIIDYIATIRTVLAKLEAQLLPTNKASPPDRSSLSEQTGSPDKPSSSTACSSPVAPSSAEERGRSGLPNARSSKNTNKKRKQGESRSPTKKRKSVQEVSLRACKVRLRNGREKWDYTWTRDGYWTMEGGDAEFRQVDGAFLYMQCKDLTVKVRPNGDWFPITVHWNEGKELFEGTDPLEEGRLEVRLEAMWYLLTQPDIHQPPCDYFKY